MTFASLAGAQLLHALTCRTSGGAGRAPDRVVAATLGVSVGIQVAGLVVPGLRDVLGIAPIGLGDAAVTAAAGLLPYAVNEARKAARTRDAAVALPKAARAALAGA